MDRSSAASAKIVCGFTIGFLDAAESEFGDGPVARDECKPQRACCKAEGYLLRRTIHVSFATPLHVMGVSLSVRAVWQKGPSGHPYLHRPGVRAGRMSGRACCKTEGSGLTHDFFTGPSTLENSP